MKPTVLALDDEREITEVISRILEPEGFEVLKAASASEFQCLCAAHAVDVFILDLNLRDANGLEIAKDLRRASDVGIIILSGRTDEIDQIVGLEIGADDYIGKPFRAREFLARVRSVHRRTKTHRHLPTPRADGLQTEPRRVAPTANFRRDEAPEEILQFGEWRINLAARRIYGPSGVEVILTTAEFDLVSALACRQNRVLTRDQIMNAVKGQDWASYDRAVDGLVSRLRQKLVAADPGFSMIKTIRGIGYMLSVA